MGGTLKDIPSPWRAIAKVQAAKVICTLAVGDSNPIPIKSTGKKMSIESQVKEAVISGRSGAISLMAVNGWNESSLSWESFSSALAELNAPSSLKTNLDKGCVFPSTPEEWAWLETAAQNPSFKFKVSGQSASQANLSFNEKFSDGVAAIEMRNWNEIRRQQERTERERQAAGYAKTRMGGFVEM